MTNGVSKINSLLSEFLEKSEFTDLLNLPGEFTDLLNLPSQGKPLEGKLLEASSPEIMKLALEYAKLAVLPHLSTQEADRLGKILAAANHIHVLSFWIAEVDHFLGHDLDLLDEGARESYKDQQSLLRERGGIDPDQICPTPPDPVLLNHMREVVPKI